MGKLNLYVISSLLLSVTGTIASPVQWPIADGGNGHYYEAILVPDGISWTDADLAASSKEGSWHLVTISSAEENAFVYDLVDEPAFWRFVGDHGLGPWIGGYQEGDVGPWKWVTGEPFVYENWGPLEPFGNGDKIGLFGWYTLMGSYWNDAYDRHMPSGYVIESETSNQPPVAICQDVTVEAEDECEAIALIDDGSYDPDDDAITISQTPPGPYPLGNTAVTLNVTDEYGATDTCTGLVTVIDTTPPVVSATVTPQAVSVGEEVSFVCTVEDYCDPVVEWDFGDGETSTEMTTNHAYASSGSYTVILYVADSSGNVNTQEFVVVVSDQLEVLVDIKPGSCPNPLNPKSKGRIPVAIVGTTEFDPITAVDPASILLEGVSPIDTDMIDSTQPGDYDPENCYNCFNAENWLNCDTDDDGIDDSYCGDGIYDLVLYFDTQEIVAAIGYAERNECVLLTLTGETLSGDPIEASDSMWILKKIDVD